MSEKLREGLAKLAEEYDAHPDWTIFQGDVATNLHALLAATAATPDEVGQVEGLSIDEVRAIAVAERSGDDPMPLLSVVGRIKRNAHAAGRGAGRDEVNR